MKKTLFLLCCFCLFFCDLVIAANYKKLCSLDSNYLKRRNFQTRTYEFNSIDDLFVVLKNTLTAMGFCDIKQKDNLLITQENRHKKTKTENSTVSSGFKNNYSIGFDGKMHKQTQSVYTTYSREIQTVTNYKANVFVKEISKNIFEVRAFFVYDYFEDGRLISMELITKNKKMGDKDFFSQKYFIPYNDFFSQLENYAKKED